MPAAALSDPIPGLRLQEEYVQMSPGALCSLWAPALAGLGRTIPKEHSLAVEGDSDHSGSSEC